jgi:hypothetical protein
MAAGIKTLDCPFVCTRPNSNDEQVLPVGYARLVCSLRQNVSFIQRLQLCNGGESSVTL